MRIVVVVLTVIVGSWVVFWGVAGAYVARRRSKPAGPAAALAVVLGPVGVAILLLRSRRGPPSSTLRPVVTSHDLI
jgi:hypothetical protein